MLNQDLQVVNDALHSGQRSAAKEAAQLAFERVRRFCESSIASRLERVESDLRALYAAHEAHRHTTLGDTRIGTSQPSEAPARRPSSPETCNACGLYYTAYCVACQAKLREEASGYRCLSDDARNAVARIAAALNVTLNMRNSDATNLHGLARCAEATAIALRSLETQHAASWAKIEEWQRATYPKETVGVSIEGPFGVATELLKPFFYARLQGGYCARGNTRSDALAHAAQWCANEISKTPEAANAKDQTCALCSGRRRDHEGADHPFTYKKGGAS